MVPSLVHGVNKTRKHWHCCIFQIVFSIPIYPLQRGFYPLKICLIPLNLKRVVYCFTMGVQKKENRADLPPVSKCNGNPDIYSSAFTEFPSKLESRKKKRLYIQAHKIPLQSDVPVQKMSALVPSRVPRYQTESVPVETFKNCWMFWMLTKMKTCM